MYRFVLILTASQCVRQGSVEWKDD